MSSPNESRAGYQFGTFQGVFTPSILTILGVIMYLRFGWVLGHAGLLGTLTIVTMATVITGLTTLSISALATNMKVGGGGAYYIISRSLGLEAGGAVGLPLYFAQALGISFYVVGFSESLVGIFPFLHPKVVGVATLVILTLLAYWSAELALRAQFVVMAIIAASLVSFFIGGVVPPPVFAAADPTAPLLPVIPVPFWVAFAVFFPAVTGIEAGLAMSGDLKNPSRSLPYGTLAAVVISYFIYLAIPIVMERSGVDRVTLLQQSLVMREMARWPQLIVLGVWAATLSSGLGSLLGAPRTLQALAKDGVVPRFFSRGYGPRNDPRFATAASFLIGLVGVIAGDLNAIAPVLSMFFLTSYGLLNVSAAFESIIASPSWRPKFNTPWWASVAGAFACFAVMFMIDAGATFVALFFAFGVYTFLRQRRLKSYWGDLRHGILMLGARFFLYRLAESAPTERTWRPNILVLSGSPSERWYLIALADAISQGKGFLTVATIVPETAANEDRLKHLRESIRSYLKDRGVPALVKVQTAENVWEGMHDLVTTYGLGPVAPNTILLGESEDPARQESFIELVRLINRLGRNLVIMREPDVAPRRGGRLRIDMWWRTGSPNSGLILALAHLLQASPEWDDAQVILQMAVEKEDDREQAKRGLDSFFKTSRLDVDVRIHVHDGAIFELIRSASAEANLVFIGMQEPKPEITADEYAGYYQDLLRQTEGFPPTGFVLVAEKVDFDRLFSE